MRGLGRFGAWGAAACLALTACGSGGGGAARPSYRPHAAEVLGTGVVHGHHWTLSASVNGDEGLCLEINAGMQIDFASAGCGLGKSTPDDIRHTAIRADLLSADAGDGYQLLYGPAPTGTVKAVIATFRLPPSGQGDPSAAAFPGCAPSKPAHIVTTVLHRLPGWAGRGLWFTATAPTNGCGYYSATFYDSAGRVVPKVTF